MDSGISGAVVAVTGAAGGIGAATARLLAAAGAVLVLAGRAVDPLERLAEGIRSAGGTASVVRTDVVVEADLERLVAESVGRHGRLDVLVANAGIALNAAAGSAEPGDEDAMIDVNLRGVLHGVRAALPAFRRQGSGHFVIVGSTSATRWAPGQAVYAATKAAVRAYADVLRQELAPEGLRVSLVSPGFTDTGFIDRTRDPEERRALERRRAQIAMPPAAVAEAIAYAIRQPAGVDVGELVVRSTAQA